MATKLLPYGNRPKNAIALGDDASAAAAAAGEEEEDDEEDELANEDDVALIGSATTPAPQWSAQFHATTAALTVGSAIQGGTLAQTFPLEDKGKALCEGYTASTAGKVVFNLLCVLSLGAMYLVNDVYPWLFLLIAGTKSTLSKADYVKCTTSQGDITVHPVQVLDISQTTKVRVLEYRYARYCYYEQSDRFEPTSKFCNVFERGVPGPDVYTHANAALPHRTREYRRQVFGVNAINVVAKSIPRLLIDEVLHPFYLFQLLSIVTWFVEAYYYYATAIFAVSAVSIALSLQELRGNISKLRSMARHDGVVNLLTEQGWTEVSSADIVPGDLIEIPSTSGYCLPCDALIIMGSCITNEAMLTGESIPVTKSPATLLSVNDSFTRGLSQASGPPHMVAPEARTSRRHLLFAGTTVIQTIDQPPKSPKPVSSPLQDRMVAMAVSTGFETAKGQLIRSILFPKPSRFTFVRDSFRFIAIMGVVALLGFFYSLYAYITMGASWQKILLRFVDLVTVAVPPALPVAMTIGTSFALSRLKQRRVFCISPPRVNVAGRLNCIGFDKTGTLTEDDLQVVGVIGKEDTNLGKLGPLMRHLADGSGASGRGKSVPAISAIEDAGTVSLRHLLASTHSLLILNGQIVGDPVDVRMLEFSQWHFAVAPAAGEELNTPLRNVVEPKLIHSIRGIIKSPDDLYELWMMRTFDFDSAIQRMSVVVFDAMHQRFQSHLKGAPEIIRRICRPDSIPANFDEQLHKYTHRGYRVLALAYKLLPGVRSIAQVLDMSREDTEKDALFAGLIVMENALKEQTIPTLALLAHAHVRSFMVTGDNILTASSVARQCGLQRQGCPVYRPVFEPADNPTEVMWERLDKVAEAAAAPTVPVSPSDDELQPQPPQQTTTSLSSSSSSGGSSTQSLESDLGRKLALEQQPLQLEKEKAKEERITTEELTSYMRKLKLPYKRMSQQLVQAEQVPAGGVAIKMDPINLTAVPSSSLSVPAAVGGSAAGSAPAAGGPAHATTMSEVELAEVSMSGDDYVLLKRLLDPVLFRKVLLRCHVFARMLPHLKQELIEDFQSLGFMCAMVGDGANDCGALRAADVGLSLSTVEASVAAPFSSLDMHIGAMVELIREGRAALVTSFSCFKYMAFYAMIQTITVSILYGIDSNMSDFQFLYIDLIVILPLSLCMALTAASEHLARKAPTGNLLSPTITISLFGQIAIQGIFQVLVYLVLRTQSWYVPPQPAVASAEPKLTDSPGPMITSDYVRPESTTLFLFSCFLYMSGSVVFSIGRDYRKSMFTNFWLMMTLSALLLVSIWMLFFPGELVLDVLAMVDMPLQWRAAIFGFAVAHVLVAFGWERYVAPTLGHWWSTRKRNAKDPRKRKLYKQLLDHHL